MVDYSLLKKEKKKYLFETKNPDANLIIPSPVHFSSLVELFCDSILVFELGAAYRRGGGGKRKQNLTPPAPYNPYLKAAPVFFAH